MGFACLTCPRFNHTVLDEKRRPNAGMATIEAPLHTTLACHDESYASSIGRILFNSRMPPVIRSYSIGSSGQVGYLAGGLDVLS